MEGRPLILFGNFSEHETYEFFNEKCLKLSGIQFPDRHILPFDYTGHVGASKAGECELSGEVATKVVVDETNEDPSSRQEVENCVELPTTTSDEHTVTVQHDEDGFSSESTTTTTSSSETNQVSGTVENVVEGEAADSAISDERDVISPENEQLDITSQLVLGGNDSNEHATLEQEVDLPQAPVAEPAIVVTMATNTMVTNTTSVGSGHQVQVMPKKSSWADLFKTKSSVKQQEPAHIQRNTTPQTPNPDAAAQGPSTDQFRHYFLDVLKKTELTNQIPLLQPRGLKNNANWCYINSTLQVLMYCPSFYHFLMQFRMQADRGKSSTPILDALVVFAKQFRKMPPRPAGNHTKDWNKQDVMLGMPFEPTYIYDLLSQVKTTLSQQGKQEDAEEFLSCILNGLHEELVRLESPEEKPAATANHLVEQPPKAEQNDESKGEWEEVGPRNKSTVTRKSVMTGSPIAKMFGGYLRSSLVQPGVKESASIQPFYTIQLDLRGEVSTVQQAFNQFFTVEEVEGFQCDKSKMEVEVSKKWTLDSLPVVLILHLKRFVFNKNACEKLTKKITYDSELQIPQDTLSKSLKIRNKGMLTYKLFAVTYHHGKNLHGGHYTSDISHPAVGWLRADDMVVKLIPTKYVFNPLSNRDPYLLYYRRGDILV